MGAGQLILIAPGQGHRSRMEVWSEIDYNLLDRNADLLGHRRPYIHTFHLGLYRDNQSITCSNLAAVAVRLVLPPSGNGVNPDRAAFCQISSCSLGTVKLTDLVPNQRLGKSLSC